MRSAAKATVVGLVGVGLVVVGCSAPAGPAAPAEAPAAPKDAQHAGITEPHGDHAPHHGGLVLMSGDVHYEVVLDTAGRHSVWFTDAVRGDLPASVATNVRMVVSRPGAAAESLALTIDEAGESWIATGQPLAGDGVMVKLSYDLRGAPLEIDIPFIVQKKQP